LRWPIAHRPVARWTIVLAHVSLIPTLLFIPITATASALTVVMFVLAGAIGICIGYHRILTHNSAVASPFVRRCFSLVGQLALQGDAIEWVATHRKHHSASDRDGDPHSPSGSVCWGHIGWLFLDNPEYPSEVELQRWAPELVVDPFISNSRGMWLPLLIMTGAGLWMAGGLSALAWGVGVRVVLIYHATWCINSVCHRWGSRPFDTKDSSRNNFAIALLTFGEGWHNNHHAFPASAKHGLLSGQIDPAWMIIQALCKVGLLARPQVPDAAAIRRSLRIPQKGNGDAFGA
jgi:fatty-acid desaturase